ncbi:Uncharacterised protein [Dermatophilus congolensis]|uniref:Uncharacterized protein n=1 Tax=Dermatophilus congolensis TaxID=1863 RepID=A0AA46BQ46_9MICO|nr:Uncharacterised protein [Dermatophilus congolensis]
MHVHLLLILDYFEVVGLSHSDTQAGQLHYVGIAPL